MIKTAPIPLAFLQDAHVLGNRIYNLCAQPFELHEIQKRVMNVYNNKGKPAYYIDPRTLDERLNQIFGPHWGLDLQVKESAGLAVCIATLNIHSTYRSDVSEEPLLTSRGDVNKLAFQKAQSAAYKRAAVKFGIGAYLYDFKNHVTWQELDSKNKSFFANKDITPSEIPAFAKPMSGPEIVMQELQYLTGFKETSDMVSFLDTNFGLKSIRDLNRDDSFRLAACLARINDYSEQQGKSLEEVLKQKTAYPDVEVHVKANE